MCLDYEQDYHNNTNRFVENIKMSKLCHRFIFVVVVVFYKNLQKFIFQKYKLVEFYFNYDLKQKIFFMNGNLDFNYVYKVINYGI